MGSIDQPIIDLKAPQKQKPRKVTSPHTEIQKIDLRNSSFKLHEHDHSGNTNHPPEFRRKRNLEALYKLPFNDIEKAVFEKDGELNAKLKKFQSIARAQDNQIEYECIDFTQNRFPDSLSSNSTYNGIVSAPFLLTDAQGYSIEVKNNDKVVWNSADYGDAPLSVASVNQKNNDFRKVSIQMPINTSSNREQSKNDVLERSQVEMTESMQTNNMGGLSPRNNTLRNTVQSKWNYPSKMQVPSPKAELRLAIPNGLSIDMKKSKETRNAKEEQKIKELERCVLSLRKEVKDREMDILSLQEKNKEIELSNSKKDKKIFLVNKMNKLLRQNLAFLYEKYKSEYINVEMFDYHETKKLAERALELTNDLNGIYEKETGELYSKYDQIVKENNALKIELESYEKIIRELIKRIKSEKLATDLVYELKRDLK